MVVALNDFGVWRWMHLLIPLVTCGKQCFIVGFVVRVHVFCSIVF
jgi:hypothetical protein